MKKDFKFFPREKDRKPEKINEPETIKDVENESKNNNNWKKKSFNSKK